MGILLQIFLGQVMGTAVGTKVFIQHGWRSAAAVSLAWCGWQLLIILSRGPHCERKTWVGWQGGAELRKRVAEEKTVMTQDLDEKKDSVNVGENDTEEV